MLWPGAATLHRALIWQMAQINKSPNESTKMHGAWWIQHTLTILFHIQPLLHMSILQRKFATFQTIFLSASPFTCVARASHLNGCSLDTAAGDAISPVLATNFNIIKYNKTPKKTLVILCQADERQIYPVVDRFLSVAYFCARFNRSTGSNHHHHTAQLWTTAHSPTQ